jgi:hypothetical protein
VSGARIPVLSLVSLAAVGSGCDRASTLAASPGSSTAASSGVSTPSETTSTGATATSPAPSSAAQAAPLDEACSDASPDVHVTVTFMAGFPPPRATLRVDGRRAVVAQYEATADGVVGELAACIPESQALALDAAFPSGAPSRPLRPDMPLVAAESTGKGRQRTWKAALPVSGAGETFVQMASAIEQAARPRAAVRLALAAQAGGAVLRLDNPGVRVVTVDLDPGEVTVSAGASRVTGTPIASGRSFSIPGGGHVDLARFGALAPAARARYAGPLTLRGTALEGEFSATLYSKPLGGL